MIAPASFPIIQPPYTEARSLRVVHVVLSLDVGGLERVVISLADHGRRLGHEVFILCIDHPGSLVVAAQAVGAQIMCANKGPGLKPATISRIAQIFKELKPDVVHTHQIGALLYAGLAARNAGIPAIVHTEHGKHYSNRRRVRWLGKLAARTTHRFFCVSEDIAKDVTRHRIAKAEKIAVISNGIDITAFDYADDRDMTRLEYGIPPRAPVIGTVGRLSPIKRQDLLLDAFAKVRQQIPDAHLLIVGDGQSKPELVEHALRLNIHRQVHFAGYQSNPAPFLRAMDVFALTSESEGMPLAILEAWATGVPVVASRVGGLPELIEHDHTGLLYDFEKPQQLVDALLHLLTFPKDAQRLALAGANLVREKYTLARTTEAYDAEYRKLIGAKPPRRI